MRKNISVFVVRFILVAFLGFVIFVILDYSGVLLKDIKLDVPAMIYENGEAVEETLVHIEGKMQTIGLGSDNFTGKFRVECVEKTMAQNVSANVNWDSIDKGFHEITFFKPGTLDINVGIQRYLYISRDMQNFALELNDGRIIATHEALAELEAIEGWRYNISYDSFFCNNDN